nr:uncharacterized protein si:dkey-91i10.2 [Gasterosteus aculeatus aculeatus]
MEPLISDPPLSPDTRRRPGLHHYPGLNGPLYPLMSRCNSSTLLTNLGLRYCSGRPGPLGPAPGPCCYAGGKRPYRSMENLNWNAVADSGLCRFSGAPFGSMDSEFILHYTSSSHWYDGPPDGSMTGAPGPVPDDEGPAFYPRLAPPRKDLPIFPQLLFPVGVDNWDARKGLREKLRLHSARSSAEHLKPLPLRPPATSPVALTPAAPRPPHLTCLTRGELKREVLRRLQLRRQNSSPNLALHSPLAGPEVVKTSYTTDHIAGGRAGSPSEPPRPLTGRLHIPTFEEFKRMRQMDGGQDPESTAGSLRSGPSDREAPPPGGGGGMRPEDSKEARGPASVTAHTPICTSPSPRSPLQTLASSAPGGSLAAGRAAERESSCGSRRRRSSLGPAGSVPFPPCRENHGRPSSCCPALLLDGTDLSSYGAKIYKMKEGLIGSALGLIKKRPKKCVRQRNRPTDTCPLLPLPPPLQQAGRGCRRSSSDAAYELAETVRAQRECRLRPHHSDPMPADASKRKQLEMKIAAAARLHGHRRDRDRDSAPAALRGRSEPPGEERHAGLGATRPGQHRWSTISSLSVDSGVVGLSDEREEEDHEPRRCRRNRAAEVERVDSGIGRGVSRTWKRPSACLRAWEAQRPCPDCGLRDGASKERGERMCERCSKLRTERKEAILEFMNTELSYGEDLRIIREEFYCPMQSAGLLSAEQLVVVFGNVQELIQVNDRFTEHLQDSIDQAFDHGDHNLLTVYIGEIFLEFVNMLPAFQTYCLQQSTSVNMLNTLEKEKELLRIFLDVSQNDNTALRRMNLRSFLMAPLQRVTKYPLLLSRIIKVTAECHPDHGRLREAKSRVESHLEHINMKTKQEGNGVTWSLRSFRRDSRKNREVINIEMREVSMKTVGWARENTRFVMEGPLQLSQPADGQWVKKGSKALKFQNVQSLLMVRIRPPGDAPEPGGDAAVARGGGAGGSVWDGVLVLIKDKSSGKFAVLREPIRLGNCVVSTDPDCEDTFEVLDIRRESFVFRSSDKCRTQQWFHQVKKYTRNLGTWRKRRNALPNIMINTNQTRS